MKLSSGILALAIAGSIASVDGMTIRGSSKQASKLMAFSRRLEEHGEEDNRSGDEDEHNSADNEENSADNEAEDNASGDNQSGDEAEENEGSQDNADMNDEERAVYFLKDYSIKLLSCIQGEQIAGYENGEIESSTVVFRLCPASSCDSSASVMGCDEGYGDYAVGISTFLDAFMESQREGGSQDEGESNSMVVYNQYGQEFDASEYLECSEYKREEGEDNQQGQQQYSANQQQYYANQQRYYGGNNNNYNYWDNQDTKFYIGPGCSADGTSIALKMYMDEACFYPSQVEFTQIAPAWMDGLPFSNGTLVDVDCVACAGTNDDGEFEISEMCQQEYQSSVARCEQEMSYDGYNGYYHYTSTKGCDYIDTLVTSVYGNNTVSAFASQEKWKEVAHNVSDTVAHTAKEASTKFMDTMSTEEARAFIAAMVIFAISALAGATLIGVLCVKKRRQRRRRRRSQLLDDDNEPQSPSSVMKSRRNTAVTLVRTGTSILRESMKAAAATAMATVKKSESETNDAKAVDDDSTVKSDYNNIEDPDAAVLDTGAYQAPDEAVSEVEEEPSTLEEAPTAEPSVAASDTTQKARGSFRAKMDKHLSRKFSGKFSQKK